MSFLPIFEPHIKDLQPVGGNGSGEHLGFCCWPGRHERGEERRSFGCNVATGLWICHGCHEKGDAIGFLMKVRGLDFKAARAEVARLTGQIPPTKRSRSAKAGGRIVATYTYHDEQGRLLYEVCRKEPNDFAQRRPDGKGGWTWNLRGVRRVLYRKADLEALVEKNVKEAKEASW